MEKNSSNLLREAIAYYDQLLENDEIAAATVAALQRGLERNKLVFGGRPLSPYLRPHFVTAEDWALVRQTCEVIWSALEKVKDAAIANEAMLDELGLSVQERDLVKIDPGYQHVSPTARLDSFLTGGEYSFVELNGESPAGIAYADSATSIFESLPVMKQFTERYDIVGFEGRSKLLEVLLECYREYLGGEPEKPPVIAVVDLKGLPTQKEFELFRDYFEASGCDAVICGPDDLEFDDGRLYLGSVAIDIVYKRLLVNEYLPIINDAPALIDAYRAGAVCVVNSFRGKLVHKKAVFAILTDDRYETLFSPTELDAINLHVPWTRRVRAGLTRKNGKEIDLIPWLRASRDSVVLKPNDDYGGHGIYIGWNLDQAGWNEAIDAALKNGDYLVQQRVKTAKEMFPMVFDTQGKWGKVEQLVDLDPLLFNGIVGSAFTRLSTSELANVSSGGGMVPTFIISEKRPADTQI